MASLLSTLAAPSAALIGGGPRVQCRQIGSFSFLGGRRFVHKIQILRAGKGSSTISRRYNTMISCSVAAPETLKTVQSTIAKQLSIDETTVAPETKFSDLGADSLDTVEIMMALEEKFGVSIGEGGAENIATVQDAVDLIEKVKAAV